MSVWEDAIIFKTVAGSQLYGTSTPESDLDIRGVCHQPPTSLLGLSPFEQFQQDEPDVTIFGLVKFCKLAADCNPNIIEILFAPTTGDTCLAVTPEWHRLLEIRSAFVSKKALHTFTGYAYSQLERINRHHRWLRDGAPVDPKPGDYGAIPTASTDANNLWKWNNPDDKNKYQNDREKYRQWQHWVKERNLARKEIEEKYGYDCKHGSHLIRLMVQGQELLKTGHLTFPRPEARWLLEIRNGLYTYDQIVALASDMQEQLRADEVASSLPFGADRKTIEQVVMELNREHLVSLHPKRKSALDIFSNLWKNTFHTPRGSEPRPDQSK